MISHQPRSNLIRFYEYLFGIAIVFPLTIGGFDLIHFLEKQYCPSGSFLTGSLHEAIYFAAFIMAILLIYFGMRHTLLHMAPFLTRWLKVKLTCNMHWHKLWGSAWLGTLFIILSVLWATALSQYCLTGHAVIYRAWPWRAFATQQWKNVREIDVSCSRGYRGHTDLSYELVMKDGPMLDIGFSIANLREAYPHMKAALQGTIFIFDISLVRKDCPLLQNDPILLKP